MNASTRRFTKLYDQATTAQIVEGRTWYTSALEWCRASAEGTPYTVRQVAHVVAALSPQLKWDKNVEFAGIALSMHMAGENVADMQGFTSYSANLVKAQRILDGEDALKGPKVEAFAANILGDLDQITIDVWVLRAGRSRIEQLAHLYRDDEMGGIVERRKMDSALRRASELRGEHPAIMQAIIWTVIRDSKVFPNPRSMPAKAQASFYRRQASARERLGKSVTTNYWTNPVKKKNYEAALTK